VAKGHAHKVIAAAAGLEITVVNDLIGGAKTRLRHGTAEAIDRAYTLLSQVEPKSGCGATRARNKALARGWPTPEQWDGAIDDPDADPATWSRTGRRDTDGLVEDAEWLREQTGASWSEVAAQLRVREDVLHRYRRRARQEAAA
jgi:hypothetical protein